tara:strand:- start:681 stop:1283 length:603 start_codon:yes stop_codon:yes gene_type:complete
MTMIEFDYTDGNIYKRNEKGLLGILRNENNENFWDMCDNYPCPNTHVMYDSKHLFVDKNFGYVYLSTCAFNPPESIWYRSTSDSHYFVKIKQSDMIHSDLNDLMKFDDIVDFTAVAANTQNILFGMNPNANEFAGMNLQTNQNGFGIRNEYKERSEFEERKRVDNFACEKIVDMVIKYKEKLDLNELDLVINHVCECIYF